MRIFTVGAPGTTPTYARKISSTSALSDARAVPQLTSPIFLPQIK